MIDVTILNIQKLHKFTGLSYDECTRHITNYNIKQQIVAIKQKINNGPVSAQDLLVLIVDLVNMMEDHITSIQELRHDWPYAHIQNCLQALEEGDLY